MPQQCRLKPEPGLRWQKTGSFPPVSSLCAALRVGRVRIGVPPVRQNIS
ncbi:hypothetical protein NEIFLAOT_02048 [Neisseria flavescens NRL30031/H210]|uniref:Uncharacterized protein n=2 Tax=Neisseria TaxID=482 RepID=C0EQ07_NEIFL|nr:hypothetical protein NEIFLAOT_02048 [Neisseria flavescens NRL30031/H210]